MKTRQDSSTKPYHKCLSCPNFRHTCGGRPTRDYDLQSWCEYIRDVKELFHLTNAYIAKEADVSIKTIERITAVNIEQDIMRSTARRIEQVVLGPVGEHTCYLEHTDSSSVERINRLLAEIEYWRGENERKSKILDKYLGGL